jgi:uncharacterized membrane protein
LKGTATALDRAIELVLTTGLLASAALLVLGLATQRPALLRLGIVLLMFTPVVRVLVVSVALLLERDWLFALISLWILGVLASSLHVAGFL